MNETRIKRGDIYYIDKFGTQTGSEQFSGRPAIIVSADQKLIALVEDGADFDADGEEGYEEGEDTYETETSAEVAKIEAERDVYKTLYNDLLNKMIGWEVRGA